MHIIISCTCWVPTISVLNLAIFPCYSTLLLKSWRRFEIHRWGVLGEQLSPVDCLWSYGAVLLLYVRVFAFVFCRTLFSNKYIILLHWLYCIHFLYGMCVNLIPGHTYYEHSVWPENRVWQVPAITALPTPSHGSAIRASLNIPAVCHRSFPAHRVGTPRLASTTYHTRPYPCRLVVVLFSWVVIPWTGP
jgi:hypothetical protein